MRPAAIIGQGAANSDYAEEMVRFLDLGYRAVKLKTGAGSVADEAERVARRARRDRRAA